FRIVQACFGSVPPGNFVAPVLIDLGGIEMLKKLESAIQGPLLHVVRWQSNELNRLIQVLNTNVQPLALGIHTRIDETIAQVYSSANAVTVYVNQPLHDPIMTGGSDKEALAETRGSALGAAPKDSNY